MTPIVVGFAGKIGSGKSTLSKELARIQGWPWVSFGNYVRLLARSRGLNEDRAVLQGLGESLVQNHCAEFCRSVLESGNWTSNRPIILDGIRHIEVVRELKRTVAPLRFVLVYLRIDDQNRQTRLNQRSVENLHEIDVHPMEVQVSQSLSKVADLILSGVDPLQDNIDKIIAYVK